MGETKPKGERKLVLSVTLADCEVQHFRAGGNGGQKVDKTSSSARIIHHPSGARGESRESRSQLTNKKLAFRKMVATTAFQIWLKVQLGHDAVRESEAERRAQDAVRRDMREENLHFEYYDPEGAA